RALTGLDEPSGIARALQAAGARQVVIKLGERGSLCVDASGKETLVPAFPVQRVVDATGAGDCWSAGFLVGLRHRMVMADAARLGNVVAAHAIQAAGATAGVPPLGVIAAAVSRSPGGAA